MEVKIRPATSEDALLIATAVANGIHDEPRIDEFNGYALSEDTLYSFRNAHIAEVDGKPVGCIISYDGAHFMEMAIRTFTFYADNEDNEDNAQALAGEYHIDTVWVKPEHRRQGIGAKLCEFAMSLRGTNRKVTLVVHPKETENIRFYHGLGFKHDGEKRLGYNLMYKDF